MEREQEGKYVLAGITGAIVLGAALIPLRELTPAANLTFPFLLLTIAIAEVSGTTPVVGTALASALSLDFFLTQPYLTLAMADKHDALAFTGLVVCGLTVAGFRRWRSHRERPPSEEVLHLDLLRTVLEWMGSDQPVREVLPASLREVLRALPLAGVVVRDMGDAVLAAAGRPSDRVPVALLEPQTLHVLDDLGPRVLGPVLPLPQDGGSLPLRFQDRQVGWLDLWGNGAPASPDARRTLVDVGRLIAAVLAR